MDGHIFISHSSQDDDFVRKLRETLESFDNLTWVDSRQITPGDDLETRIEAAVRQASYFIVVVSMEALGSQWVQKEVKFALDEAKTRDDGYKVIPVALPGITRGHLKLLFPGNPHYITVDDSPTGLSNAKPAILSRVSS